MATFDYNPLTGELDLVGSGASYINGVVADPTALPVTVGTPPLDSVYLAKAGSGVWLINRKPAGLYCRVANNGNAADWTYLGAFPEVNADGNWELYNSTDPTKELKFDLSGLPTATTRTVNAPDGNGKMLVEGQSIGATTRNTGAFTTLNANNGTITASAPVLDLAQTWNNAAAAFTGIRLNVTNTASANTSDLLNLQIGGTTQFRIRNSQLFLGEFTLSGLYTPSPSYIGSTGSLMCATQLAIGNNLDTILIRDGASGALAQRNGTNAQTFRLYNTYTDASNYERGFMRWNTNVLQIGTEKGGTGSARALEFQTDGTTRFTIASTGASILGPSNIGAVFGATGGGNITLYGSGVGNQPILFRSNIGAYRFALDASASTSNGFVLAADANDIAALRDGTDAQIFRIYNTVSGTNNVNFERANFRWASNEFIIDAEAGGTGTSLRGIKIGSATSSLLGFYGVTPVDQPATVADPAGGGTVDTEARTAINAIIDRLQELGLIA